ncbi:MAG: ParA family protein [Planctomycetota bacterium]|jgi:chromosome partitioning protein
MSLRICLINQKGGCGKSSLCFHLSGEFVRMGLKVLLIDCDPQGSLSQGFLGPAYVESLDASETLAGLFDDSLSASACGPVPMMTPVDGISLVPANLYLARYNAPQPERSGLRQHSLRAFVDELAGVDVVLLDCPPNLYQCTWNALMTADYVAIPVPPEDFGTQGLAAVHQAIENARRLNSDLELLGHIVTRCDHRLLIHRAYEQMLRQLYPETVLSTVIPEAAAFKVALASRQPVSHLCARSKAAQRIRSLATELLERASPNHQEQRTVA